MTAREELTQLIRNMTDEDWQTLHDRWDEFLFYVAAAGIDIPKKI